MNKLRSIGGPSSSTDQLDGTSHSDTCGSDSDNLVYPKNSQRQFPIFVLTRVGVGLFNLEVLVNMRGHRQTIGHIVAFSTEQQHDTDGEALFLAFF